MGFGASGGLCGGCGAGGLWWLLRWLWWWCWWFLWWEGGCGNVCDWIASWFGSALIPFDCWCWWLPALPVLGSSTIWLLASLVELFGVKVISSSSSNCVTSGSFRLAFSGGGGGGDGSRGDWLTTGEGDPRAVFGFEGDWFGFDCIMAAWCRKLL